MTRVENWEYDFITMMEEAKNDPFVWGKNDCAMLVARNIKTLTGIDIAKDYHFKYKTAKGAAQKIKQIGNGELMEVGHVIAAHYGFEEILALTAQRGDVVIVTADNVDYFGINIGSQIAVVSEGNGFATYPREAAVVAWRIE